MEENWIKILMELEAIEEKIGLKNNNKEESEKKEEKSESEDEERSI